MRSSIRVGTILEIPVEINYTWVVIFGLVTWTLARDFPVRFPSLPSFYYWSAAIASSLLLFISLLLHELAHSYVARMNGIPIKKITLFIFGGVAQMEREPEMSEEELLIAVAGPVCSLMVGFFAYVFYYMIRIYNLSPLAASVFEYMYIINFTLVVFNIIPGFPLDGGRMLRAVIWYFNKNLRAATKIATTLGKWFAYLLMFLGVLLLFQRNLMQGVWLLVVGLFLHEAAEMSYQQLILKKALVGVPCREIMSSNVITVPSSLSLDRIVNDYFFKYRHIGFPVVDNEMLKGIVTLQSVKEIHSDLWSKTPAEKAMIPAREDLLIGPEKDALEALLQVTRSGLGRLLVVEDGRLLGILVQRDLLRLFEIKTNLCV